MYSFEKIIFSRRLWSWCCFRFRIAEKVFVFDFIAPNFFLKKELWFHASLIWTKQLEKNFYVFRKLSLSSYHLDPLELGEDLGQVANWHGKNHSGTGNFFATIPVSLMLRYSTWLTSLGSVHRIWLLSSVENWWLIHNQNFIYHFRTTALIWWLLVVTQHLWWCLEQHSLKPVPHTKDWS